MLAFAATYRTAKSTDAQAALGSDIRLTPADPANELPDLGSGIAAVSPLRLVSAQAGSDRKTIMAIDLSTYPAVSTMAPRILEGQGPRALGSDPLGVLLLKELAVDFEVGPGDTLPITIYPDDFEKSTNLKLHVLGVYGSFPPTSPPPDQPAELVVSTAAIPPTVPAPPDFYLAHVAPGHSVSAVAAELGRTPGRSIRRDNGRKPVPAGPYRAEPRRARSHRSARSRADRRRRSRRARGVPRSRTPPRVRDPSRCRRGDVPGPQRARLRKASLLCWAAC